MPQFSPARIDGGDLADDGGYAAKLRMSVGDDFDVIVIGLGVLGASALRALARDGARVLGIEQFHAGNSRGSSHGRSRAVRYLYHAPEYVQLLRPAIEGWRELQAEAGDQLYWNCGTLFFARPGNEAFESNVALLADGGVGYEMLDGDAARRRFPAFAMTPDAVGVFIEDGGMVDADASVAAFLSGARAAGAEIREGSRVLALDLDGNRPRVTTDHGALAADHVVIAAGAWTNDLLPDLHLPLRVTGQTWITMRTDLPAAVDPSQVPVWCDYETMFYGFPDHGPGLKIADDTPGPEVDPHALHRPGDSGAEQRRLAAFLQERFPSFELSMVEVGSCLYTLTPDEDFIIDTVPGSDGKASVAVGLNHAFKFAPVIGQMLSDLAMRGASTLPLDRFRIERFPHVATG
jgi:sarcosine oxidase